MRALYDGQSDRNDARPPEVTRRPPRNDGWSIQSIARISFSRTESKTTRRFIPGYRICRTVRLRSFFFFFFSFSLDRQDSVFHLIRHRPSLYLSKERARFNERAEHSAIFCSPFWPSASSKGRCTPFCTKIVGWINSSVIVATRVPLYAWEIWRTFRRAVENCRWKKASFCCDSYRQRARFSNRNFATISTVLFFFSFFGDWKRGKKYDQWLMIWNKSSKVLQF